MVNDRALITQMLDVLIQHPTDDGYKDQRWEAILAAREYLAAPEHSNRRADPFTYIIQHLNSNPYNMTKDECVVHIKKLRDIYNGVQHLSDCAVHNEPAYPAGDCDCGAAPEQSEPIKHKHEWFRTGAMEPGVCRCIHCGEWSKEDTNPAPKAEPVNKQLLEALKQITDRFEQSGAYDHDHTGELARAAIAVAEQAQGAKT